MSLLLYVWHGCVHAWGGCGTPLRLSARVSLCHTCTRILTMNCNHDDSGTGQHSLATSHGRAVSAIRPSGHHPLSHYGNKGHCIVVGHISTRRFFLWSIHQCPRVLHLHAQRTARYTCVTYTTPTPTPTPNPNSSTNPTQTKARANHTIP